MYAIEEHYYKINRILLLILGIWPYQTSTFAKVQKIIISSILGSGIFVQLAALAKHEASSTHVIDILSYVFPSLVAVIKYYYFLVKTGILKQTLECIQTDWNLLKNQRERDILESYAEEGRSFTNFVTLFSCSAIFAYITLPISFYIINICLSHNTTYSQYVYIPINYSINQEKYLYIILLHFIVFTSTGIIAIVAIGTFLQLYLKHACGLLKIASCRMEHALDMEHENYIRTMKQEYIMGVKIIRTVHIQQKALKFTDRVMSSFTIMYFLLIIIGTISVSIFMFRLFRALRTTCDFREIFMTVLLLIGHFLYIFMSNYAAQEVTDHCNDMFLSTYNSMWYIAPLRTQKLILFLLQHGTKNFTIILGGIFVGSLEGFATILSSSISYFMMIYTTQMTEEELSK